MRYSSDSTGEGSPPVSSKPEGGRLYEEPVQSSVVDVNTGTL
jgi:hypothetical protein